MAVHTWGMEMTKIPEAIIEALRNGTPIKDDRLGALRSFTAILINKRGNVEENMIKDFLDAGYTTQNIIEIIGGISAKLVSDYTNVIAKTPLDEIMKRYEWVHPDLRLLADHKIKVLQGIFSANPFIKLAESDFLALKRIIRSKKNYSFSVD